MAAWAAVSTRWGNPPWYVPAGNLTWACVGTAQSELQSRVERLRACGYQARLLTLAQAHTIEPGVRIPSGAVIAHFPGEGFVHGRLAAEAFIARARQCGATLITGERVAALKTQGGRVTGVRLASGGDVSADVTVCAAGWRTPGLLATADTAVPLQNAHDQGAAAPCLVAATTSAPGALQGVVHAPEVYARTAEDGGLLLEASDLDAATDLSTPQTALAAYAAELLARAQNIVPAIAHCQIAWARRCVRPLPADGLPLVGGRLAEARPVRRGDPQRHHPGPPPWMVCR
jgi:glycine/D-amino acid oxidase-like deaminating enzyme